MRNASWAMALLLAVGTLAFWPAPAAAQNNCTWNGDALYVDSNNDNRVSPGDARISPAKNQPAGHRVLGADADSGVPLANMVGIFRYFDVNGDGQLDSGDRVFWDSQNNGLSVGDIYLSDLQVNWPGYGDLTLPFGLIRGATDPSPGYPTAPWPIAPSFAFIDDDGDGNVDPDDGIYAAQNPALGTRSKDARISTELFSGYADGTLIRPTDGDSNKVLSPTLLNLRFADLDSSGGWNYPSGSAWSNCPNGQPWQLSGGQTQPPAQTTTQPPAQQTTPQANTGNGGGGKGGISWTTVALIAAVVLAAAYVIGNMSKKKP